MFIVYPLQAQSPLFEQKAWKRAEQLRETGYFQDAAQKFGQLSLLSEQQQDWEASLYAANRAARSYGEIHRKEVHFWIEQAQRKGEQILPDTHPERIYTHFVKAIGEHVLGNYEQANTLFSEVLPQFEQTPTLHPHLPDIYLMAGKNAYILGRFEEGRLKVQQALDQLDKQPTSSAYLRSESYRILGAVSIRQRDIDQAETYKREALRISQEQLHDSHPGRAAALRSWGVYHDEVGKDIDGVPFYKESLEIYRRAGDYLSEALVLNNLGNAVNSTPKGILEAIQYFQQSIYAWETKQQATDNPEIGTPYYNLSVEYTKLKQYDKALYNIRKTLEIDIAAFGKHNIRVAEDYRRISYIHSLMGQYEESFEAIQYALQSVDPEFHSLDRYQNPQRIDVQLYQELFSDLNHKANILQEYYEKHSQDQQDLKMALQTYEQMGELVDYIRTRYDTERSKLYTQRKARWIAAEGIEIACKLYAQTQESAYLNRAFRLSEKSKAVLLAEAFSAKEVRKLSEIPDEVWEREKALKQSLTEADQAFWEEQKKNGHADSTRLSQLQKDRFQLKSEYRALIQSLRNQYPEYYDLSYDVAVSSVAEIQQHLDEQTALLSYFVGYETLYVFTITQDQLQMKCLRDTLLTSKHGSLTQFAKMVSQGARAYLDYEAEALTLYQQLVEKPLEHPDQYPNLILIPDGHLGYLPFELLLTEKRNPNETYRDLKYLIHDHTCSYAYSATLLLKNQQISPEYSESYAGFAPTYSNELLASAEALDNFEKFRSAPVELEGTYDEVNFAQSLFGGKAYLRDEATEQQFKELKHTPAILHLAMHALVDDEDPMQSKLLFTSEQGGSEDGFLNAYEIYNMQIPSQLAILSACNTGFGKMKRGEGIMSLSRAFMYAGCPSIVMSMWRAKDQPTGKIMNAFFQQLKEGKPKDDALRLAKLEYLSQADPLQAHPSNWATFVVVGNADPLVLEGENDWVWWLALGGLFLLGLGWGMRRR